MIDFRFHLHEETYVVWIAGINRYLQFKEPAFRVFEQWAKDIRKTDIVKVCTVQYSLPEAESIRFVEEITNQVQSLFEIKRPEARIQNEENNFPLNPEYLSAHTYQIGKHYFRFIYRNEYLKDLFHPLFRHHESDLIHTVSNRFELFNDGHQDGFRVDNSAARFFPVLEIDAYQGAVFMEVLNALHQMENTDWMGVIHASAVTDGNNAVIFAAPSGSGKTSVALLMMVNGFSILSDDFVPVAMNKPEIYHFPAGISVKKSALTFLQKYLPQLHSPISSISNDNEVYLPPSGEKGILPAVNAKSIVFVNYDPLTEYELKKESNLEVMNQLIKQSWIAGTPEAAEQFLSWYFSLSIYTLRYSNNSKAVEGIRTLFG
jgi:hypothetical protein